MKIVFLSIILSSCSFFIKSMESKEAIELKQRPELATYCVEKELNLHLDDLSNKRIFAKLLKQRKFLRLNFIEKSLLWTLYQFYISPEAFSPTARFQILLRYKGKIQSLDFNQGAFPAITALRYLAKNYPTQSLPNLLNLLENELPKRLPIGKGFATFLQQNKSLIKSKNFKSHYYKADEALKPGETFPKPSLKNSLLNHKTSNRVIIDSWTPYNQFQCTESLSSYSIYESPIENRVVGISDVMGNIFILSSSLISPNLKDPNLNHIISGKPGLPSVFCIDEQDRETAIFVSYSQRSPSQILKHFLDKFSGPYGLLEIDEQIRESRHMKLHSPQRLLVEKELDSGLPQFYAKSIGKILGYYQSSSSPFFGFIDDPRNENTLECH